MTAIMVAAAAILTALTAATPASSPDPDAGQAAATPLTAGWPITAGGVLKVDTGVRGGNTVGTVTAVNPEGAGHLTVWPCGTPKPVASTLNYTPGVNVANSIVAKTSPSGELCFYSSNYTHLLWDQSGSLPNPPVSLGDTRRLLDTRQTGAPPQGGQVTVVRTGSLWAAYGTVTAVNPEGAGHLTVWPCGTPKPVASTLNYTPGVTIANSITTPTGPGGELCIYTSTPTHLLWDQSGEVHTATDPVAGVPGKYPSLHTPQRLLDTRAGGGAMTKPGEIVQVQATPAPGAAAYGTVTAVNPEGAGHLTVWPCGTPKPVASTLNYTPGVTIANSITTPTGDGGKLCIYTSTPTHVLWDQSGRSEKIGAFTAPSRKLDTRLAPLPQHPRTGGAYYPNVSRWAGTVWTEMQRAGVDRKYLPGILAQIQQESSGIPTAVNNWDSNWVNGYASFGLLQTIYPTFNTYARPECRAPNTPILVSGRWQQYTPTMVEPGCNISAGLNYVKGRYKGTLFDVWNTGKNLAY